MLLVQRNPAITCCLERITDRGNVYLGVSIDTTSDMDTEVIIKKNKSVTLEDLLPFAWDAETWTRPNRIFM